MERLNKIVALGVIGMFVIEFLMLLFADYSQNTGASKGVVLLYFTLTYLWFTIPAILSIVLSAKLSKKKTYLILSLLLNGVIFISGLPMLLSYF